MKKQITKRCHWVAQSYLRAFASDDKKLKIWRFSKDTGEPENKPIKKVAVKLHLYAPKAANGRPDDGLEKKLARLENLFADPLWSAVCNEYPDLSQEPLRKMVALLVAVTLLRTPKQFESWKSVHEQLVNFSSQDQQLPESVEINHRIIEIDQSSWPAYRDATEEDLKRAWNKWIGQAAVIAEMFIKMRWAILVSENPVFITSDNPVLLGDTLRPHQGLRHPGAMVSIPLSPTRVLVMDNRHNEPDARFYPLNHDPGAINVLTWRNAIRDMFSSRHPDQVGAELIAHAEQWEFSS